MKLTLGQKLIRTKPTTGPPRADGDGNINRLGRSIGLFPLTMIGVGATIGTGIFFTMVEAVPKAGPAVIVSFLLAAITAGLTALCYAELSFRIPAAGSSYSFAYATVGEFAAFIMAFCLLLEYGLAASATAIGWSGYLNNFLTNAFHWQIPEALRSPMFVSGANGLEVHAGHLNLPPILLVILCGVLLLRGTRESATANAVMVLIKLAILLFFVVIAFSGFNIDNFHPFFEASAKSPGGMAGVTAAAATVFFSFIGLDTVATAGEEVRESDPQRAGRHPGRAGHRHRVLHAGGGGRHGRAAGENVRGPGSGPGGDPAKRDRQSLAGHRAVGRRRHFRVQRDPGDHLRPDAHPVRHQPRRPDSQDVSEGQSAHPGAGRQYGHRVPDRRHRRRPGRSTYLWDMVSIGTLTAFIVVSIAVPVLRAKEGNSGTAGFRVPFGPYLVPALSIAACLYLVWGLSMITYVTFAVWMSVAVLTYLIYGVRNSKLNGVPVTAA